MDEPMLLVEPCDDCRRHIRRSADACPFCGAPHEAKPVVFRGLPRARLALAGGAMLLAAACGSPEGESSDPEGDGTGGGEVVEGSGGGGAGSCGGEAEPSCAGVCGSHHDPVCDENGENCVAPPYGAPPLEDPIV